MKYLHLILILSMLCVLLPACSGDDDDDLPPGADDDDDTQPNDDDAQPECTTWKDCDAPLTCRDGECVQGVEPVVNAWAYERATQNINEDNLLISGKDITPVGDSVYVGTQPTRIFLTPDQRYAVVNESTWGSDSTSNRGTYYLQTIDIQTMQVVDKFKPQSGALWHGLQLMEVGGQTHVWATDGPPNNILQFTIDDNGMVTQNREINIPECFTTGIIVDQAETTAYVTCLKSTTGGLSGQLAVVDLATEEHTKIDNLPGAFTPVLSPDGSRLFLASISTIARPVDGDVVWVFDTATMDELAEITVGWGPQGMVWHPQTGELYVACNATDDIYVIDPDSLEIERVISLHNEPAALKGMYPVWLDFSPDGETMYVTASHDNSILVMDTASGEVQGQIPTAWYPNDLEVTADGQYLIVSDGRGYGEGPADVPGPELAGPGRTIRGTVSKIVVPDPTTLGEYTLQVEENNNRPATFFDFSAGNDTPVPSPDEPLHKSDEIKYVFFVLKENMAYDAGYGDLEVGDGDPEYALWGEEGLPNQRMIAREFVLFDNFYCLADSSIDGHQWPSAGIETDFIEKHNWHAINHGFSTIAISLTPGTQPESLPIMPHLIEYGIDVLGLGGIENFGFQSAGIYSEYLLEGYDHLGGFHKPDFERAGQFKDEFERRLEIDDMPPFTWIFIGNNHGHGLSVGAPTPEYWIRENDLAVGIIIDTIMNSPIWEDSLIFITEDDSQNGLDHIDKHRCAAIALSPWLKRNYVSSVLYTINNFQKTLELLMGVPPMHRLDAMAPAMYDIFRTRPDTGTIQANLDPVDVEDYIYTGNNKQLLDWSARMDWSDIDLNPDAAEFYYTYKKGKQPPKRNAFYKHRIHVEDDD